MRDVHPRQVEFYRASSGQEPFSEWLVHFKIEVYKIGFWAMFEAYSYDLAFDLDVQEACVLAVCKHAKSLRI